MKFSLQLFCLCSTILASLLVFADGSCQIVRRPVNVDEEMDDLLKVPDFLMKKVEAKLTDNKIYIEGINVCEIQDMEYRSLAVNLIFELVAEDVTDLLDWFTGIVIQIIRLRDYTMSLETFLFKIQSTVFKLNTCLKYLYDNRANVTQAIDRYLFLSDIIFVYRAVYDTDTYGPYLQEENVLALIKKKTNIEWLQISGEVVPPKSYLDLLVEAKTKIVGYIDFYNQRYGCGWLYTDKLKWKSLMKYMTIQHLMSSISGKTLQHRYIEITDEVDSTKVIAFYAEVAETVTVMLAQKASDIISLFVDYLLVMMDKGSLNYPIRHNGLKSVITVLSQQLNVLKSLKRFMISTLHLKCPSELLLNAIVAIEPIVNQGLEVVGKQMLEEDLTSLMKLVKPDFVNPVNASDPEKHLDIVVTENETTEKLKKILKDMRGILLGTSVYSKVMLFEK